MNCPKDVVQFVTDWWELSGSIVTTVAALRRFKDSYPKDYLLTFCHANEIADGAAALQEICQYFDAIARMHSEQL